MLVNCPRCGFQQPKDQYCAQCGVDMNDFKAPTASLFSRVFGNPILQLSLLLMVAGGIGVVLVQSRQDTFKTAGLKSSLQINASEKSNLSADEMQANSQNANAGVGPDGKPLDPNAPANAQALDANGKPIANANSATGKDARGVASTNAPVLTVYYVEVRREALSQLFQESPSAGQINGYPAGLLPLTSLHRQVGNSNSARILHKEIKPLGSSNTLQWSYSLKDRQNPNVEVGMTTFLDMGKIEGNNLGMNVEIQLNWYDPRSAGGLGIQRKSFAANIDLTNDTGFFIANMIPHQNYAEGYESLMSYEVFKILASEQFRNGDTELVIFIEFSPVLK